MSAVAPILFSVPEVADRLSVTERYVRSIIQRGELPHVRIGRRVLVTDVALADFVEAHTVGVQS